MFVIVAEVSSSNCLGWSWDFFHLLYRLACCQRLVLASSANSTNNRGIHLAFLTCYCPRNWNMVNSDVTTSWPMAWKSLISPSPSSSSPPIANQFLSDLALTSSLCPKRKFQSFIHRHLLWSVMLGHTHTQHPITCRRLPRGSLWLADSSWCRRLRLSQRNRLVCWREMRAWLVGAEGETYKLGHLVSDAFLSSCV